MLHTAPVKNTNKQNTPHVHPRGDPLGPEMNRKQGSSIGNPDGSCSGSNTKV